MYQDYSDLAALLSPEFGVDEEVDWAAVEGIWGTDFPSDYKFFMSTYGCGSINDSLHIMEPPSADPQEFVGATQHLAQTLWHRRNLRCAESFEAYPNPGGLILWATDYEANDTYWQVTVGNPDQWPIVVFSRGYIEWIRYEPGMAKLLFTQLTRGADEGPLSIIDSAPGKPMRFLNTREEERLNLIEDPWPDLLR